MYIAELAMKRQIDCLYRCDSMPVGRAYFFGMLEGDVYIRPDGTTEKFDFTYGNNKYRDDLTWRLIGHVKRLPPIGALDLIHLASVLTPPEE